MTDSPISNPPVSPEMRERELCAKCGSTLYNHVGNTGCIYPCWTPSGTFSVSKKLNNPFPVRATPLPAKEETPTFHDRDYFDNLPLDDWLDDLIKADSEGEYREEKRIREEILARFVKRPPASQPSSSSEIREAILELESCAQILGGVGYRWANDQNVPTSDMEEAQKELSAARSRLESLYLEQREDAARWRAVLPTLTVRNVGLAAYASTNEFSPDFTWRKTWLESRKPLEGVALNPIEFADALRALSTKGTPEK